MKATERRRARIVPIAAAALAIGMAAGVLGAAAQQKPPEIPDAVVQRMIQLGLQNIHRGLCGGLSGCAPATPEEYQLPPITLGQARVAILTGTQSAVARWCGLDADRRSIGPTMRLVRQKFKLDERQVALIAIIHGIQQSVISDQLKSRGECDAATRSKLDAELPKG